MLNGFETSVSAHGYVAALALRAGGATPTQIAKAAGVAPNKVGGILSSLKKHIDRLKIRPDTAWQQAYVQELKAHIEAQGAPA